ncbi:MAG: septation protein IspZ [Planctomycetota bacterium]|nr:septation protein IspZ [Planctomycetota bacterium]
MTQNPSNNNAETSESGGLPSWVRPALEFSPALVFLVVQRSTRHLDDLGGLYWATISLMIVTPISLIVSRVVEKRWPIVPLVTGLVVGAMGGLTIYLNSELFIKMKPTILYGIMGGTLLFGLLMGRLFLRSVLGKNMPMDEEGWTILTRRISLYFFALAGLNEIIRRVLSTDHWTLVKTFGFGVATAAFFISQVKLIEKHWTGEVEPGASKENTDTTQNGPSD